jgi:hypothetical protein
MWSKSFAIFAVIGLCVIAGCGAAAPSVAPWGDFQARALDTAERIEAMEDSMFGDAEVRAFFGEQQQWIDGAKADPCYDPAFRQFRSLIRNMLLAMDKVPTADLSSVALADLNAGRDALQAAIQDQDALDGAMLLATQACN